MSMREGLDVEELRRQVFGKIRLGYSELRCPRCGTQLLSLFHSGKEEVLLCLECQYGGYTPDEILSIDDIIYYVLTEEFPSFKPGGDEFFFAGVLLLVEIFKYLKPNAEHERALAEMVKEELDIAERLGDKKPRNS
jgi:hypothetical protein